MAPDINQNFNIFNFESSENNVPLQANSPHRTSCLLSPSAVGEKPMFTQFELSEILPTPPRRTLRARKPEQQMPYTLDLMRHRDQFRRRGLKPVHNPDSQRFVHEQDEQYHVDEDEADVDKDERCIPPKGVEERAPKRRRVRESVQNENKESSIHLHVGRKRFLDPGQFDVHPEESHGQQVVHEQEVN